MAPEKYPLFETPCSSFNAPYSMLIGCPWQHTETHWKGQAKSERDSELVDSAISTDFGEPEFPDPGPAVLQGWLVCGRRREVALFSSRPVNCRWRGPFLELLEMLLEWGHTILNICTNSDHVSLWRASNCCGLAGSCDLWLSLGCQSRLKIVFKRPH